MHKNLVGNPEIKILVENQNVEVDNSIINLKDHYLIIKNRLTSENSFV